MRSRFVHPVAAFAMSGFWFIVLFPFVGRSEGFGARDLPVNLIATCLAGLTVAMIFRRSIVAAEGARFHLLAIVLPGVAAFAFGCFVVLFQWLGPAFRPGGKTSPGILLVPIYCVVFGHLALVFVTLPMGYCPCDGSKTLAFRRSLQVLRCAAMMSGHGTLSHGAA